MGLLPFLLDSLIAKHVRVLGSLSFSDCRTALKTNLKKIKQKLNIIICCVTKTAIFCELELQLWVSYSREEKELHCHCWLRAFKQVLLAPSVLHTALQAPATNIPQTKINTVSQWVKSLNKQKYQQSASSLCPRDNGLFVRLKNINSYFGSCLHVSTRAACVTMINVSYVKLELS